MIYITALASEPFGKLGIFESVIKHLARFSGRSFLMVVVLTKWFSFPLKTWQVKGSCQVLFFILRNCPGKSFISQHRLFPLYESLCIPQGV